MVTDTKDRIIAYIRQNKQARVYDLVKAFNISNVAVHKQLRKLIDNDLLGKVGRPPKVYYYLTGEKKSSALVEVDGKTLQTIESRYLFISASGEAKYGWEGFRLWCEKTKQEPIKTAAEYVATLKKYDKLRKDGLIDGMRKMKHTFSEVFLDKLFYLDFYSIERFGKTKLGQMLLYAKQSQNRALMRKITGEAQEKILKIIRENKIDGVLFIPPTVKREVQFMRELESELNLPVRILAVAKVKTEITVPQKTLSKLEDRIENAKRTIAVDDTGFYTNILLIDDAVGSGATLNETARQIRRKGICKGKIIGLAITGSYKGFDVISEV